MNQEFWVYSSPSFPNIKMPRCLSKGTHQTWRGAHRRTRQPGRIPHCQSSAALPWGKWRCHCQPCCRWAARKPAAELSSSSGKLPLLSCLSPWFSSNHRGMSHIQKLQSPKCPQGSPVRQGVRDSRICFSGQVLVFLFFFPSNWTRAVESVLLSCRKDQPNHRCTEPPWLSSLSSAQLPRDTSRLFCFFFQAAQSFTYCMPATPQDDSQIWLWVMSDCPGWNWPA